MYPREVEEVLMTHPSVREASVIGLPHDYWGESGHAIVSLVPGRGAHESELISYCRSKLSDYKRPKSIEFMADLPKNAYGKVLKRKLRERALERLSADRLPGTDQMTKRCDERTLKE